MKEWAELIIMKEILPLGSVVSLKRGSKRVMIAGRLQTIPGSDEVYEYCAVPWPDGLIRSDMMYLFNSEDLETIWFIGLQDPEEFRFRSILASEAEKTGLNSWN